MLQTEWIIRWNNIETGLWRLVCVLKLINIQFLRLTRHKIYYFLSPSNIYTDFLFKFAELLIFYGKMNFYTWSNTDLKRPSCSVVYLF